MIWTVTLNPSLDYHMMIPDFTFGRTNRSKEELVYPGGKGINVSVMLTRLGIPNIAVLVTGGFTGEEIVRLLIREGVRVRRIGQSGNSRINVKLDGGSETELNAAGPRSDRRVFRSLENIYSEIRSGDVLVLAGSLPEGYPKDYYRTITDKMAARGVHVVVDASGQAFREAAEAGPFLMKPNRAELEEYFRDEIHSVNGRVDILEYAKRLQEKTKGMVLLSCGSDGASLVTRQGVHTVAAPDGTVRSATGAGDAMVAGFLAAWLSESSDEECLKRSVAAGSASAFSEWLADSNDIEKIYREMR